MEGMAAVSVGGGRAWPPHTTTQRAGVKGAAGPGGDGRGVRGRRQGLATTHNDTAPPVWRAWSRCPWAAAGPGRHTQQHSAAGVEGVAAVSVGGGRAWPGFETTRRAEGSRRGRRAGGPPPTGTYSDPARRRPGAPAAPPGHAKGAGTEVPAPHSATTSSRLRLNQAQPWRRRRIHRRRPPAAAAPRPAVPTRLSKPVRARRCARLVLGFVAGASGAT